MRICAFDSETRGLWGNIFKVGFYDGILYHTFETGLDFLNFVISNYGDEELHIYGFNLEFDFSKILKEAISNKKKTVLFEIDFNKSLVINGKFHVVKIKEKEIYFRDIYPVVNCSLDKACKDFELSIKKLELETNGLSKDEYFKTVKADDCKLLEYVKNDVLSTFELFQTIKNLSGLDIEKFVKCPTVASLSMKIFKTNHADDFAKMKETKLYKWQEDFVRESYSGGRVEIFKPKMENGGYHYDINSLYPSVMEKNKYPIGRLSYTRKGMNQEGKKELLKLLLSDDYPFIIFCRLNIPSQNIGVLPIRNNGKLIFPVGIMNGHFCRPEIEYAIKNCGLEVLEIYEVFWWMESDFVFKNFIGKQKDMKMNSKGAKKFFAKLIQNANYGKWGMQRDRVSYENYEVEKFIKIKEKGEDIAVIQTGLNECMVYKKLIFADYILPHYASFITSFARVELLKQMKEQERKEDRVYYCDTDSIVCEQKLNEEVVSEKEYGKWKLEREIEKAIFVLPKLYAEIEKDTKIEILKSKGFVKDYADTISYSDYEIFYEHLKSGKDYTVYGYNDDKNYYSRYNIIQAIKRAKDFDEIIKLRKKLAFSRMTYKRIYSHTTNSSIPITLNEDVIEELVIDKNIENGNIKEKEVIK